MSILKISCASCLVVIFIKRKTIFFAGTLMRKRSRVDVIESFQIEKKKQKIFQFFINIGFECIRTFMNQNRKFFHFVVFQIVEFLYSIDVFNTP